MEWIAVDDRLPDRHTNVIGYDAFYGKINIAEITPYGDGDRLIFLWNDDCNITHWQPLPEPPNDDYLAYSARRAKP